MRCAVLLCLLSSLAYGQAAAPMAPAFTPPAATPAGTGLYRPNAPAGHPATPLSPHKRVLPPTKEPGLWAGDVRAGPIPRIVMLDVLLPIPPDAKTAWDVQAAVACASAADVARYSGLGVGARFDRHAEEERRCIAAGVFLACTHDLVQRQDTYIREHAALMANVDKRLAELTRKKMEAVAKTASGFYLQECNRHIPNIPPALLDTMEAITRAMPDPITTLRHGAPQ